MMTPVVLWSDVLIWLLVGAGIGLGVLIAGIIVSIMVGIMSVNELVY